MSIKENLTKRLFTAYYEARRHKRKTKSALEFELNLESNLLTLRTEILTGNYQPAPPSCFIVNKPVKREVFAADFRDRVVHHLIFNYINPLFEKLFINDCYSCRIGKGTSYGIKRVQDFLYRATIDNDQAYVLKLDISGYFMSINQQVLYKKIEQAIVKRQHEFDELLPIILGLIKLIVFQKQTVNCRIKGNKQDWVGLPKDKSLFFTKPGNGLPIGNLTSQLFANVYLNDFDQFIKRDLKIKYYGRYVDDMVIINGDKKYLESLMGLVRDYLLNKFGLKLHPKKIKLTPASGGVLFLGMYLKPTVKLAGNRTKRNFYGLVNKLNHELIKNGGLSGWQIKKFYAIINSYLGFLGQTQSFGLKKKIIYLINKGADDYYWLDKRLVKINIKNYWLKRL